MLYDYYGFPNEAYDIQYPAPGNPELAGKIIDLLDKANIPARLDPERGFDHGVWDGGTGGYGYTECLPEGGWAEGSYEVQVFIGDQWKSSARFDVLGDPATATEGNTPV